MDDLKKLEYSKDWTNPEDFPSLTFTKDWESQDDFPTIETDETQVRADMQYLYNEIRDYVNGPFRDYVVATGAAENNRQSNEETRQSNEQTRQSNEQTRQTNEETRKSNEAARVTAEGNRATAEGTRANAEAARVQNETERKTAEASRASAETARANAETQRAANETARQQAETQRQSNEAARQNAESQRVSAENARNVWEDYSASKAYAVGNKVAFAGSSYLCIKPCTGIAPPSAEYWRLIAAKGNQGDTGPQGPQGNDGKSAYTAAQEGGYTGSEETFSTALNELPGHLDNASIHVTASDKENWNQKANLVITEIPKGRMRGDIKGTGKVGTVQDLQSSQYYNTQTDPANPDSWACDIDGDGWINFSDYQELGKGTLYSTPLIADFYNKWTYHKVDNEPGYWTTDLAIPAITAEMGVSIVCGGSVLAGIFIKAEPFAGGVRIYANYPPIEAVPCAVSYTTGASGQIITADTGVSGTYVQDAVSSVGAKYAKVKLTVAEWSEGKEQIVSVPGLKGSAAEQLIIPTQSSTNIEKYYSAGIRISARADDELTFSCETIPTEDITVILVIIPIIGKFE